MKKLLFHPLLAQVPLMALHERDALGADIEKNGQILPVITLDGKIIDGRNRYLAMIAREIEPKVKELTKWEGRDFVASMNYFRKHWTTAERAHFAALMSLESERGNPETKDATPLNTSNDVFTEKQAAEAMNVSVPSVQRAKAKIRGKKRKSLRKQSKDGQYADKLGFPVPPEALPYMARRQEVLDMLHHLSAVRAFLEKIPRDDKMYWYVKLGALHKDLGSPINQLTGVVPDYVCWKCDGVNVDKCDVCKGTGVLSEYHWKKVPKEKLKAREEYVSTRP